METYPIASLQDRYNLSSKQSVYDIASELDMDEIKEIIALLGAMLW